MRLLPWCASIVRNVLFRRRADDRLREELDGYVATLADERVREGLDPERAHRLAVMSLGGRQQVVESVRDARAGGTLDGMLRARRDARRVSSTTARSRPLRGACRGSTAAPG